jgi:PAS domain S-box-containing protein
MENKESCEITSINYKKDGEQFWVDFSISPVANHQGLVTHFIALERDITLRKNEDLQKSLLYDLSRIFNSGMKLPDTLTEIIKLIYSFGGFCLAEAWLTEEDNNKIKLVSSYSETRNNHSVNSPGDKTYSLSLGEGHAGLAWKTKEIQYWRESTCHGKAMDHRKGTGFAIPLLNNEQVIGVLIFEHEDREYERPNSVGIYKKIGNYLGPEIKRKQLEQELEQLFKFAPGIISVTGMNGLIKKINPAACELLEYPEEELMKSTLMNFVHVEDRGRTDTEYENLKKGKPVPYLENRFITKSGKVKWLAWALTSSPREGEIYSVAKDITEKKELEVLLHKATDLARIGSWELDLIKNKVYWSEITREIHEVQPDYVPGLETAINFYREGRYRSEIILKIQEAIENGKNWDGEFQIITRKGNKRWIRIIGEPEMVNGKCVRIYGSFQDIDKRKKSEENIRSSEESKKLIMNSALDAIIFIDSKGAVTFWNPQAERIFGWKENEVLGKVLSSLIIPEAYRSRHDEGMKNYLRTGEGPVLNVLLELSAIKRGGEEFPIELTVLPVHQEGEEFFCAFIRDITQRKNSESRLVELNDSLQKQAADLAASNEDLEQFAYIASHDLQEPLRMISSFLSQLENKYAKVIDDKGRKYIYYAKDGATRMRQIILDLLEFSRVGRMEGKKETVDLNEVMEEIRILFRKEIRDKNATILLDPLPVIQINKTPLRQVFHNLISNALKYSRKEIPVQIQITAVDKKTHWQFAVADNGIGIEKEYFDRIFIIFQRLHGKEEYSGTGMGLAVTKKIVETWGGKIYLESTVEKGSKFYFTLPV